MKNIPYGRQYIDSQDIRLVSRALKEDLITTGHYVKELEEKISKFLQVKYTVTCNNATSGLHLALLSVNLKKDDVIIMPAINFIAVYNMAKLLDALRSSDNPAKLLSQIDKIAVKKAAKILEFLQLYNKLIYFTLINYN